MSGQLREFLDMVEGKLDLNVDLGAADGDHTVVCVAPVQGGLVGLDEETGKPVRLDWKYKTIHEKPVILNVGTRQTVIKPAAQPLPPPAAAVAAKFPMPSGVAAHEAGELYEAMRDRFRPGAARTEAEVGAKNAFVMGCLEDHAFYAKWRSRLGMAAKEAATETAAWPRRPKARRRTVDT